MVGFKCRQEDPRQFAHMGGLPEIGLHEVFNAAAAAVVCVSHRVCHLNLHVKGQLVDRAPCDQVQMAADRPKKIFCGDKGFKFFGCKDPQIDQIGRVFHTVDVFADPEQGLQITEPALAFFHIGFDDVALPALLAVARGAFFQLGFDKITGGCFEEVGPEALAEFRREIGIAGQIPVFHKRGADRVIFFRQTQAVFDRAAGVSDLQFQIP